MFLKEKIPSDIWSDRSPAEKLKLMYEFYQSVEDFVKTHEHTLTIHTTVIGPTKFR